MHAIRQHAFGPAENLHYEEVDDPTPDAGQVRIAVAAAGVHLIDLSIRAGEQSGPFPLPELPMTPGREVAGVVDTLGEGVESSWLGRRVVAHLGPASGGYAELAVAGVGALHEIPDGLSDETAVAMIGTGRTAIAILDVAGIGAADVVLVTSAAGGLGSLFVQAAVNVGATVVGLAGGAAKIEQVRRLGASAAIDYTLPDWPMAVRDELGGREITVVLDGVGGEAGQAALGLLGVGGRLVMHGFSAGTPTQLTTGDLAARGLTVSWAIGARMLRLPGGLRALEERALTAAASGILTPLIGSIFPLAKAADAHTALGARATVGKVMLKP